VIVTDRRATDYTTSPTWQTADDARVSAEIRPDPQAELWSVTVRLTLPLTEEPVPATDIEAILVDDRGTAMLEAARPSGVLAAAVEELRTTADARFAFRMTDHAPAELVVEYRGRPVRFGVAATRTSDDG
jgi:hypothetical protein